MTEWIGGRRPVAEALAAGRVARRLLIARGLRPSPELKAIRAAAARASAREEVIDRDELGRLAGFDGHQGLLLEVEPRRWSDPMEILAASAAAHRPPFILVLEQLQDPVNLGAVLRTAEAAGVDGVIFPDRGSAPLSAAAVKSSAGASEHLRLAPVGSLGATLAELQARGLRLVAADQDAPALAWDTDLGGPLAVVVGGEGAGLTGATRRRCDVLVRFPMAGQVASLNAAAAGALLLFEVVRQRGLESAT
ncbi:MAG TPA: 23S rRNA (guanosine(2251)-2'-O)-methyltransferase RlmB [Candidatus Limnocylindria bacterium]|nr:23S rRNA (guanosine(2251)-2'-O)-methyltransferase RlmB [Candidatus Limnocylindria bacterium]